MSTRRLAIAALVSGLWMTSFTVWSAPILNGGWATTDSDSSGYTDHIATSGTLNVGGAYAYSLSHSAMFRITDVLNTGDVWTVFDFGSAILTTTLQSFATGFGDNAEADGDWIDSTHTKGEVLLAAGNHSIAVSGDGQGGIPAHYFARIDGTVPEPSTIALLCAVLGSLSLVRLRGRLPTYDASVATPRISMG